jgi:hypothetical protein
MASSFVLPGVVRILIENGADVNAPNESALYAFASGVVFGEDHNCVILDSSPD